MANIGASGLYSIGASGGPAVTTWETSTSILGEGSLLGLTAADMVSSSSILGVGSVIANAEAIRGASTSITGVGSLFGVPAVSSSTSTSILGVGSLSAAPELVSWRPFAMELTDVQFTSVDTNYIDFTLEPSPAVTNQEGRLYWDSNDGTMNIGLAG
ncbi:MAG: hypothetical protein ACYSUV_02465, partial [Planctomycetota bacterium]